MAGTPVAIVIMAGNPMAAAAGRIIVVAANPDPASVDPFVMAGNPDGIAVRALPATVVSAGWWWRAANTNIEINGRSRFGTNKQGDEGHDSQHRCTKREYFHIRVLDLVNMLQLQKKNYKIIPLPYCS